MPYLAGISVYPIKSLDPLSLRETSLLLSGALEQDREFAVFDAEGKVMNGKRTPLIHGLHALFDKSTGEICLTAGQKDNVKKFILAEDNKALEKWLSDYFEMPVTVHQNKVSGFPDDKNFPGPTVISTASLEEVASWFPGLTLQSARVRFRANLEIGGVPPFWEDCLYGASGTERHFQIGDALFHGTNPCQRCVVPPRDPETGDAIPEFSQIFRARREATLPLWAEKTRFNHFYRLAVNTRVPAMEAGKTIRIGDPVVLL